MWFPSGLLDRFRESLDVVWSAPGTKWPWKSTVTWIDEYSSWHWTYAIGTPRRSIGLA